MGKSTHTTELLKRLQRLERKRRRVRRPPGSAPGAGQVPITNIDELRAQTQTAADDSILWLDLQGFADTALIEKIGQHFGLHPLVISDVVHVGQRPKTEIHDDYVVIILRQPRGGPPFDSEQITLVLGKSFVLTFQELHGDIFDPVRKRMREGSKRLRAIGASYLGYALVDAIVDGYFPILEAYGELTETLEQRVIEQPHPHLITDIHVLKRELLEIRRALWSQREAVNVLLRDDTDLITDGLKIYLRDCADHSFQLLDMVEVYREVSQGLVDLHLSSVSNRMNEIMKALTVTATTFIPMTFVAGLYGMNFDRASPYNLPELGWVYGYPFALGLMALSSAALLTYFWRKGSIGNRQPRR